MQYTGNGNVLQHVKYNKKLANLNYFLNEINKELFGEIYD